MKTARDRIYSETSSAAPSIELGDAGYPANLREISTPPERLFVRGTMTEDDALAVAIVGSRTATSYGLAVAERLAAELAGRGITVVSGLARGIDSAAHRGALRVGGRTLAVLGSGVDVIYPPENRRLAREIEGHGALISQFAPGTRPLAGHFPARNRVIAGLSLGVVVVEAAERSGALVTARLALEEGREVMAVPGFPGHPASAGANQLIRDGACLVRQALDVAEELGLALAVAPRTEDPGDEVLAAVRREVPSSVEEIQERSGRPAAFVLSRLAVLEMGDKIRRLPGALFVRN